MSESQVRLFGEGEEPNEPSIPGIKRAPSLSSTTTSSSTSQSGQLLQEPEILARMLFSTKFLPEELALDKHGMILRVNVDEEVVLCGLSSPMSRGKRCMDSSDSTTVESKSASRSRDWILVRRASKETGFVPRSYLYFIDREGKEVLGKPPASSEDELDLSLMEESFVLSSEEASVGSVADGERMADSILELIPHSNSAILFDDYCSARDERSIETLSISVPPVFKVRILREELVNMFGEVRDCRARTMTPLGFFLPRKCQDPKGRAPKRTSPRFESVKDWLDISCIKTMRDPENRKANSIVRNFGIYPRKYFEMADSVERARASSIVSSSREMELEAMGMEASLTDIDKSGIFGMDGVFQQPQELLPINLRDGGPEEASPPTSSPKCSEKKHLDKSAPPQSPKSERAKVSPQESQKTPSPSKRNTKKAARRLAMSTPVLPFAKAKMAGRIDDASS